jgi:hypothetical protein
MAKEASQGDAISEGLKALLEQVPILRNVGTKIVLAPHQDLILKARAQGHSYREIARALAEAGIKVSPQTLRRYILRVEGTKSKRRSRFATIQHTRER